MPPEDHGPAPWWRFNVSAGTPALAPVGYGAARNEGLRRSFLAAALGSIGQDFDVRLQYYWNILQALHCVNMAHVG